MNTDLGLGGRHHADARMAKLSSMRVTSSVML